MAESRTNSSLVADLLIDLDRSLTVPLHRQIAMSIRGQIRAGRLRQGSILAQAITGLQSAKPRCEPRP